MSETNAVSPLRQRMIEDMAAGKLSPRTQRSHIHSCGRFAAWLKRSPDTAKPRRRSAFPTAPHRKRREHLQPQSDHDRGTVPVPRYATSPRSGG
jgi:hypothetical protein